MKKIYWHLMNWQEVRDAQKTHPVVIIPAGTVETQGPYTYIGLECVIPERLAPTLMKEVSPNYAAARGHGADPGLSQAMYLEPEMVDTSRMVANQAASEYHGMKVDGLTPLFNGYPLDMALRLQDISPESGGYGDPRYASKEQGEKIFERMVEHVTALVDNFAKMKTRLDRGEK